MSLRAVVAALFLLALTVSAQSLAADSDGDGLTDEVESLLLEQFRPNFMVSASDCDRLPARLGGVATAELLARDATIYGQVSPHASGGLEVRYYHLWWQDCGGRSAHPADVEHVSALLQKRDSGDWIARYWYAAAHQDTVCDRSMAVRAADLHAERVGPVIWISAGKHASYLTPMECGLGCGGDSCPQMQAMPIAAMVNLGEPGKPSDSTRWAAASPWPMSVKSTSDFEPRVLAALQTAPPGTVVRVARTAPGLQRTISVSSTTLGGLETGQEHAAAGLGTAKEKTGNALQRSYRKVKGWLGGK